MMVGRWQRGRMLQCELDLTWGAPQLGRALRRAATRPQRARAPPPACAPPPAPILPRLASLVHDVATRHLYLPAAPFESLLLSETDTPVSLASQSRHTYVYARSLVFFPAFCVEATFPSVFSLHSVGLVFFLCFSLAGSGAGSREVRGGGGWGDVNV